MSEEMAAYVTGSAPSGTSARPARENGRPKGLLPLSWINRPIRFEFVDASGTGQSAQGVLLDSLPFGVSGVVRRREGEERAQAEEERQRGLEARFDELAPARKKLLADVEKALDALDKKAKALLEVDEEQRTLGEKTGRYKHVMPYDFIVRDRILARLGDLLSGTPGVASGRHTPITEDDWFTATIAEDEKAGEIRRKAKQLRSETG